MCMTKREDDDVDFFLLADRLVFSFMTFSIFISRLMEEARSGEKERERGR
jgi:hypothetical protein